MSKKFICSLLLVVTVAFILIGAVFKISAQQQTGLTASNGVVISGEYYEQRSGTVAANEEKYNSLNINGNIFLVLGGITGAACVVLFISSKKPKNK